MRRSAKLSLAALSFAAVGLLGAACGSTPSGAQGGNPTASTPPTTTSPTTTTSDVVLVTQASRHTTYAKVGDLVEVELTSTSYNRSGSIVPWGTPRSSAPSVLAPVATPSGVTCGKDATCTFFSARSAGAAMVVVSGPSGIICSAGGQHCVAVTAALDRLAVSVAAA